MARETNTIVSSHEHLALHWYDISQKVKAAFAAGETPIYVSLEHAVSHGSQEFHCNVWLNNRRGSPLYSNIISSGVLNEQVIARREVTEQLGIRLLDFYGLETYVTGRVCLPQRGPVMLSIEPLSKILLESLLPQRAKKFDIKFLKF